MEETLATAKPVKRLDDIHPVFYWNMELAGATGLEPAASCVTGRRSNQLNYAPA